MFELEILIFQLCAQKGRIEKNQFEERTDYAA